MTRKSRFALTILLFGYAFLYLPLGFLVLYSFNDSRYVTIWTHFSFKWYTALFENDSLLRAAATSLEIAFFAATLATLLGTCAAVALGRLGYFRGRGFLRLLCQAPMILPEVILGLGFLLAFIAMTDLLPFASTRGMLTIIVAHSTVSTAYVMTIVRARLTDLDMSLLEAAMDLGARPIKVFLKVTLPLIMPSLLTGWMLAFLLSFDDLVISSFVSGAEVTTLPMAIFSRIKFGLTPEINVLGTLIMGALFVIIIGVLGIVRRKRRL